MKIATQNIDEFLESLADVQSIFNSTIRVSINRRPENGNNRFDATKFTVYLRAACIVELEEGQYLLETENIDCGCDYADATAETEGSNQAKKLKERIKLFATEREWRILPGLISE